MQCTFIAHQVSLEQAIDAPSQKDSRSRSSLVCKSQKQS